MSFSVFKFHFLSGFSLSCIDMIENFQAAALGGQETNVVTDYVLKVKTFCNNQTINLTVYGFLDILLIC